MKTLAAILVQQRSPLVLDEVELPPLRWGQVLVETLATRICGSQIGEIDGVKGADRFLPHLLGHEGGGVVREVGPEVTQVKPGDHVVMHWRPGRGLEPRPPVYTWQGRPCNAGSITTFNQFAILAENRVTPVPASTDPEICALLADTLTTGFGVINNNAVVRIGESVVVIGVGGIGLGTVLGAHLAGAHPIVAIDLHDHKLAKAREFGATHIINSTDIDFAAAVEELLGGKADVVVDGTGIPAILERAFALAGPRGRCVGVGVMHHEKRLSINTLPINMGRILTGSQGGESRPAEDVPRYLRMMNDGRFDPSGFVTHRYPLDRINEGIDGLRVGDVIHAMVNFS